MDLIQPELQGLGPKCMDWGGSAVQPKAEDIILLLWKTRIYNDSNRKKWITDHSFT